MKKTILAMAIAPLCLSANVFAQDTVVVTASRVAQPIQNTLAPIVVVEKTEIEDTQAKSLGDVLKRLPGVQVDQGGYGQATEIYVRGTSSQYLLVLIDGVRFSSATSGASDVTQIPLTGVERIEFIRGPRASIYGADAMGGVLNVITSYQGNEQGSASVTFGSDSYEAYEAGIAGDIKDNAWAKLSIRHEKADGFSATSALEDDSSWEKTAAADDDGFKNTALVADMGVSISEQLTANIQGYWLQGEAEYDQGDTYPYNKKEPYNLVGKLAYENELLFSELIIASNRDSSNNYNESGMTSSFITRKDIFNWLVYGQVSNELALTGGVEWLNDKIDTTSDFNENERNNKAAYLNLSYLADALTTEASIRFDDNEAFGNHTTWQLALGYLFFDDLKVIGSAGTAFRAPTFNELYYPAYDYGDWGSGSGNPNLKPEESISYELAFEGQTWGVGYRVSGYITEIDNLIASDNDLIWFPENINKAKINGIDTSLLFTTGPISHDLSYNYVDAKNDETDKQLVRRAKHLAKWNLNYKWEQLGIDFSSYYKSSSYNDSANTEKVDGYITFDFAASYYFNNGIVIRGQVANLFDEDYEPKAGYNGAERAFYGTLAYQF